MPINKYTLIQNKKIVYDKCLDEYTIEFNSKKVPRILKCGDTFCTECLEKARTDGKIICLSCENESGEEVEKLIINKCVINEYRNEIFLNLTILDTEIKKFDLSFSIGIMGERNAGKTSIAHYFQTGKSFEESPIPTIGFDYHFKFISLKNKIIKVTLWDTAGQETFTSLSAGCLRGVQSLLLVFDLTIFRQNDKINYKEA